MSKSSVHFPISVTAHGMTSSWEERYDDDLAALMAMRSFRKQGIPATMRFLDSSRYAPSPPEDGRKRPK